MEAVLKELEVVKTCIPPDIFERLKAKAIEAMHEDRYLTASQVMQRMGITSRNTLTKWIDEYGLHCTRLPGGHIRIKESDLEKFLKKQQPKTFVELRHDIKTWRPVKQEWYRL